MSLITPPLSLAGDRLMANRRVRRWMYDPVAWATECIQWPEGGGLSPYQAEVLSELPQRRRIALRGPHGLGKSTIGGLVVLWFATTRDLMGVDWKVITTASAWRHLEIYLWPEIHKWEGRIVYDNLGRSPFDPRREFLDLRLKLSNGAATAVASNDPAKIEGAHADSLLYLLDEAKTIPPATWDSVEGAFSGAGPDTDAEAFALAMSTPGPPSGRFYDISTRRPGYEDWWTRHVTLDEAVEAGRISRDWADQRRRQWGEDSALYANRVLGEFHASDEDSVIPLSWLEAAVERWHEWQNQGRPDPGGPMWIGVDVGRGGDETILALRNAHVITELEAHRKKDTMATVALVQARPGTPIVDVVGVGAGVYDRLREAGAKAVPYAGSAKAVGRDRTKQFGFFNGRSAAYWFVRELLDPSNDPILALPPDDLLLSDLTAPTYDYTSGVPPKIRVETKDAVVARLGRSPDRGDAVVMSLFADMKRINTTAVAPEGNLPTSSLSPLG